MTDFLVRHFIPNYSAVENTAVRTSYGILAGVTGIFCNFLLFAIKLVTGLVLRSVSVTADAFNNLSDAGSSIISLIGVRMAEKPADEEHPFGHGRIEHISALIVAFLIIEVGFTFLKSSFTKILHPEELVFQTVSVVILILSIGIKLWLGAFNKKLGNRIHSQVMLATSADAMGDVVTTSATIVSLLIFRFFHVNVDGIVGLVVAGLVMWSGIGIAKDTLEPLIGAPIDPALYKKIKEKVESYPGITGSHDLIIHNYGPGRSMATIHAELSRDADMVASHELIDKIERDTAKELGILLVIHMDPVETSDPEVLRLKCLTEQVVHEVDPRFSIHDFRLASKDEQPTLFFDLVVPSDFTPEQENQAGHTVMNKIFLLDNHLQCVITIDKSYVLQEQN